MADNRCVCCGEIIPEGMIACPNCLVVSKKKTEMKPCPFCGGKPYIGRCFGQITRYSVKCRCGVLTQFYDRRYKAIEAWNRRAEDGK